MKFNGLAIALVLSMNVFGAIKWGSKCGLEDAKSEGTWTSFGKLLDLGSTAKPAKIAALPTLTKQQIIITAKHETPSVKNTQEAVEALRENSESSDLIVQNYVVNGERYTEVTAWPGGNPYGTIFVYGTTHAVAYNEDDSIRCK